ncbi:hypothetical protein HID58_095784 [Brassica napus]|uniref:Uncharacterized protein n=1 Tax=Brassica napus TaxID=3708 RepID=A0ABQ7X2D1_BRANA|nr:hypothetical protein HID58_095784 [Brassica napus]
MVGSETTNAAENDRINRNLLILRQTTEKEKKGSTFSNIGCFHLWPSSTALTPYLISRQPTYMREDLGLAASQGAKRLKGLAMKLSLV